MTIGYRDLRKGLAIELDGEPYAVVEYERSKMQQRAPVLRVRFRSLRTGRIVDRSFNGYDVKLTPASVERRTAQYIYEDGDLYYFMDVKSFDQLPLSRDQVDDSLPYLVEQTTVNLVFYQDEPIAIELPTTVDLTVTDTDPGFKGDTAQGGTKLATLETGLAVQVPLFVEVGAKVRVDTRTGQYLARV
jgi:elongation factor P